MGFFDRFRQKSSKEPRAPKQGEAKPVEKKQILEKQTKPAIQEKPKEKTDRKENAPSPKKTDQPAEAYTRLIRPLITEKGTALQGANKYVFEVAASANAVTIARAVEQLYGVRPTSVNIMNQSGKWVRYGRTLGRRRAWKKAIITLKDGDTIQVYTSA